MNDIKSFKLEGLEWAKSRIQRSKSPIGEWLIALYKVKRLRSVIIRIVKRLEGGEFFSQSLRQLFKKYHNIEVGKYSYGCFYQRFPPGTKIGSYVSVAEDVHILRRNHPYKRLSQHPFFYNHLLGLVKTDTIEVDSDNPLKIGNEVWIGRGTLILPGCREIGNGAIIGANSVITKDVPAFAIMGGNPAKKIRDRYNQETIDALNRLKWWDLPIDTFIENEIPYLDECTPEMIEALIKNDSQRL